MTASNSRVRDSIRRIALSDPDIRAIIEDYKNQGGIASDSVGIEGAADDRAICCDGSTPSGTPGATTRNPASGGQDASEGLNSDDPADLVEMGQGSLSGVKDCATGQPIEFQGADCIPPSLDGLVASPGWIDCVTFDGGWEEGYHWHISVSQYGWRAASEYAVIKKMSASFPQWEIQDNSYSESTKSGVLTIYNPDSGATFTGNITKVDCSVSSFQDYCDLAEAPSPPDWPSDGVTTLYTKGGKLVASKYDPEASSTTYLKGVDSLELCDDFGNSFSLAPSASGGWKTIDPSSPGDGYLYDANGKQIARISGSEYSDPAV